MQVENTAPTSEWKQETGQCFWKVSWCCREMGVIEDQVPEHRGASLLFYPCSIWVAGKGDVVHRQQEREVCLSPPLPMAQLTSCSEDSVVSIQICLCLTVGLSLSLSLLLWS